MTDKVGKRGHIFILAIYWFYKAVLGISKVMKAIVSNLIPLDRFHAGGHLVANRPGYLYYSKLPWFICSGTLLC